ncbi:MAG TPA: 50S ribosomal protein L13 [Candidatus Paceibacterota bacterium]|nr:50S ribosomal protein L13 [Candidatus Paceibacterota bacterium]
MEHTIDAKDKKLGRVASEAARILMGKNRADFARHRIPNQTVRIINASAVNIDTKKRQGKTYQFYSGYPGGQKTVTLERLIGKKGYSEAFRKAVRGMLPPNKLRARMLKQLIITE